MREYTLVFREGFSRGLRASKNNPKNFEALVLTEGAVPEDGILRSLEDHPVLGIDLGTTWPFPQVFNLKGMTLVCTATELYEYSGGEFIPLMLDLPAYTVWSVADFWPYVIATNGAVIVRRNPQSWEWEEYSNGDVPLGTCMADVNGQLFVGGFNA